MPMPGRSAEARNQAIQAQGVAEALLKRIKAREREIQGSVLEARSQVDRNESALRSARSDAERSDLRGRLVAARRSLQEWEEIKALSGSVVFSADTLGRVRGQINVSATNLRDDRPVPTLEAMTAAQRDAERLLALSDQIVEAVRAKLQAEAVLQGLQDLASSERVRVDTTALQAALKKASDLIAQGQYGPAKD